MLKIPASAELQYTGECGFYCKRLPQPSTIFIPSRLRQHNRRPILQSRDHVLKDNRRRGNLSYTVPGPAADTKEAGAWREVHPWARGRLKKLGNVS